MNLSESEFFSLSSQMSDRDVTIASLKEQLRQKDSELLVTRSERDKWQMKYEQLKMQQEAVELENQLLRNYLWLSWEKIKAFVACVKDIRLLGFLQSFMQKPPVVPARRLRDLDEVAHAPFAGTQRGARPREAAVGGDGLLGAGGVRRIVRRKRRLGEPRERARPARGLPEVRVGDALEREVARAEAALLRDAPARGAAGPAVLVVHPRAQAGLVHLVDARADAVEPRTAEVLGGEARAAVHEEAAEPHLAEDADLRAAFVRVEPGVPRPEGRPSEIGSRLREPGKDRFDGLHGRMVGIHGRKSPVRPQRGRAGERIPDPRLECQEKNIDNIRNRPVAAGAGIV